MRAFKNYLFLSSVLAISACTSYGFNENTTPSVPVPGAFSVSDEASVTAEFDAPWWLALNRPDLNALIDQALDNNQQVLEAYANLKQAQALVRNTRSDLFPQIQGDGNISKDWERGDAQQSSRNIGASLSWEVDVFNRIGAAAQADRYEAQARSEDIDAIKLAISAEVANAYFGAAAAHRRLELLQDQLTLDRDLQDLLQLRLDNGVGTNVEVLQQRARVADSETLIPLAEADLSVFENRLDVLLGTVPDGQMRVPDDDPLNIEQTMPAIGVPAALLLNRPDLRAMRAELAAADSDIAAAISDRLPRITIDGSYAYTDTAALSGPVAMLMGAFVQPLLDWGKRKAEVERNKTLYEGQLAAYTQNFLEAVEDVENAIVQEEKQREFLQRLIVQRDILQETAEAAEGRYTQGIDDYLPVIDALQELRQVERSLITEQLNLVNFRIDLYRAIGGPIQAQVKEGEQDE